MLIITNVIAQADQSRKLNFNVDKNGIAVNGYDPVAYIVSQKAIEGDKKYAYSYKGVTYLFASNSDLALFKLNPDKYEPAYGGWCAYAMGAKGEKVEVDPKTFKIINSRLYLFYNFLFTNTLTSWNKDEPALKSKADKNWNALITK